MRSIQEAQDEIEKASAQYSGEYYSLLLLAKKELGKCGDEWNEISDRLNNILDAESKLLGCYKGKWAEDVYVAVVEMKRYSDCKKQLARDNGRIDGETAQWVTTIVQGVIGAISTILTILFALGKIPNLFGKLGESQNSDALYYVIGTVGQQVVAVVIALIIGIINRARTRKAYDNQDFSFEELLAVKYEDKPKTLAFLYKRAKCVLNFKTGSIKGNRGQSNTGIVFGNMVNGVPYMRCPNCGFDLSEREKQ